MIDFETMVLPHHPDIAPFFSNGKPNRWMAGIKAIGYWIQYSDVARLEQMEEAEKNGGIWVRQSPVPNSPVGFIEVRSKVSPEEIARYKKDAQIGAKLPDPNLYVDPDWDAQTRDQVIAYLERPDHKYLSWLGIASCRICGIQLWSPRCQYDQSYVWPSGLSHYLREHAVRLPDSFVQHALREIMTVKPL